MGVYDSHQLKEVVNANSVMHRVPTEFRETFKGIYTSHCHWVHKNTSYVPYLLYYFKSSCSLQGCDTI